MNDDAREIVQEARRRLGLLGVELDEEQLAALQETAEQRLSWGWEPHEVVADLLRSNEFRA